MIMLALVLGALLPSFAACQTFWAPEVLINAGATSNYSDTSGDIWMRDRYYRNSAEFLKNVSIANTLDDTLYQTYRSDISAALPNMIYNISLQGSSGELKIVLHWAELEKTAVGERVFHVQIDNKLVLQNFDVMATAGGNQTAITQEFFVNATSGFLKIVFVPKIDLPFISAIGVYSGRPESSLIHQPKITVVDPVPKRAQGSISMPEGSRWCGGRPTYWWVGHDNAPETPRCQQVDGSWTAPQIAKFDTNDTLNAVDGPENIDRHHCTLLDMNADGILDIACVVGADKGLGTGFNEIYITKPNGSLRKILKNDLQKYPTMRTRLTKTVTAADGGKLVIIANEGVPRTDGQPNEHRMFRLVANITKTNPKPRFAEVMETGGPWIQTFQISCLQVFDLNNDGIDDIIMCNQDGPAQFMMQKSDLSWLGINLSSTGLKGSAWNDARVADVTGDGIPDLIACGPYRPGRLPLRDKPFVRVFKGDPSLPLLFDFEHPYYEFLPAAEAMDVEILDLNGDGILDIYVVLMDRSVPGSYCAQLIGDATPGMDTTHDYVLVGTANASQPFKPVEMLFERPGCAGMVGKWGNHSLMLVEAILSHQGASLLLEW